MWSSRVIVGRTELKNPLIAGSAEHLIEADGVRCALRAGAGAVVVKSTNNSQPARDQLQRAEYLALDADWRPIHWDARAPRETFIACRSGLAPQSFDAWLEQTATLDREARTLDSYAVASLIFDDLESVVRMARTVEQVGLRVLERYSRPSPLHRRGLQHPQTPLRARLSEPRAIRGSTHPATCQNRRLKLSTIKGALWTSVAQRACVLFSCKQHSC